MKLKIYRPHSYYDVKYHLSKPRELDQIEAIIITLIYYSKENKSMKIIEYLLNKLKLESKWTKMIELIINDLLTCEELLIENHTNIKIDELFLGDIKINPSIEKSIKQNDFFGLEKTSILKNHKLIIDMMRPKEVLEFDEKKDIRVAQQLSNELIAKNKNCNQKNEVLIQEWPEKKYNQYFLKKKELEIFEDDNSNIVFHPEDIEYSIDLINNVIKIEEKNFYDLISAANEYNFIDIVLNQIENQFKNISKVTNPEQLEIIIDDIEEYSNINKLLDEFDQKNVILYKGSLCHIGNNRKTFKINNNEKLTISFPSLSYKLLNSNELNDVIETFNLTNWVDIIKRLTNENQKLQIINQIFYDYKEYFVNENYKKWIIENSNEIPEIDRKWLFESRLVSDDEFNQFCKYLSLEKLNSIFIKNDQMNMEIIDSENKINYLLEKLVELDIEKLNLKHYEIESFKKFIVKKNKAMENNSINEIDNILKMLKEISFKIKQLNRKFQKEITDLNGRKKELIMKKKDKLIEEILIVFSENIKGHLEDFLSKYNDNKLKWSKDIIKKIEVEEKLNPSEIEKLEWLREQRNKWAHTNNDKFKSELNGKTLDELRKYFHELNTVMEIFNKKEK